MKQLGILFWSCTFLCTLMISASCSKDEVKNRHGDLVYEGRIMEQPYADGSVSCVVTKAPFSTEDAVRSQMPYPDVCRIIFQSDSFPNVSLKRNMVVSFQLLQCKRNPDQYYMMGVEFLGVVKPLVVYFEPNYEEDEIYEGRIVGVSTTEAAESGADDEVCCIVTKAPVSKKEAIAASKPFAGECYVYFSSNCFPDATLREDVVVGFHLVQCCQSTKPHDPQAAAYDCNVKPISLIYQ